MIRRHILKAQDARHVDLSLPFLNRNNDCIHCSIDTVVNRQLEAQCGGRTGRYSRCDERRLCNVRRTQRYQRTRGL